MTSSFTHLASRHVSEVWLYHRALRSFPNTSKKREKWSWWSGHGNLCPKAGLDETHVQQHLWPFSRCKDGDHRAQVFTKVTVLCTAPRTSRSSTQFPTSISVTFHRSDPGWWSQDSCFTSPFQANSTGRFAPCISFARKARKAYGNEQNELT